MNAHAKTASARPVSERSKRRSSDREFLPAALEILETPPSPIKMALLLLICGFFATALVWSYFGRVDIVAGKRPANQAATA